MIKYFFMFFTINQSQIYIMELVLQEFQLTSLILFIDCSIDLVISSLSLLEWFLSNSYISLFSSKETYPGTLNIEVFTNAF
jgi:hypothetical protein